MGLKGLTNGSTVALVFQFANDSVFSSYEKDMDNNAYFL